METESKELPEDLIMEILLKVPIKAMMRFKTVSKGWLRLINSKSNPFSFQLQRSSSTPFFVLRVLFDFNSHIFPISILGESDVDRYTITKRSPQIDLQKQLDKTIGVLPVLFPAGYGITAIFELIPITEEVAVYLWNPVTNQYKVLPSSPYCSTFNPILGFAAVLERKDEDTFTYKVGRVLQKEGQFSLSLELYSSETKSWKFISNFSTGALPRDSDHIVDCVYHCVNLNGKVHWMIQSPCIDDDDIYITVFDYETEVFTRIKAPKVTCGYYDKSRCIVTLFDDKFLCIGLTTQIIDNGTSYLDIWVLRQYENEDSWVKEFTIGPLNKYIKVLGFSSKAQVVFLWDTDFRRPSFLLICDCKSSKITDYIRMRNRGERIEYFQVIEGRRRLCP